jgi:hypothetical protein
MTIDYVALIHQEGDPSAVELFSLNDKDWPTRVVQAAHHMDEQVVFVSTLMVKIFYNGDLLAYIKDKGEPLPVRQFIEALKDDKRR